MDDYFHMKNLFYLILVFCIFSAQSGFADSTKKVQQGQDPKPTAEVNLVERISGKAPPTGQQAAASTGGGEAEDEDIHHVDKAALEQLREQLHGIKQRAA